MWCVAMLIIHRYIFSCWFLKDSEPLNETFDIEVGDVVCKMSLVVISPFKQLPRALILRAKKYYPFAGLKNGKLGT